MPVCYICGKSVRTAQGLRGHMTFVHGAGRQTEAVKLIKEGIEERRAVEHKEDLREQQLKRQVKELQAKIDEAKKEYEKRIEKIKAEAEKEKIHQTQTPQFQPIPQPPPDPLSLLMRIPNDPVGEINKAIKKLDKILASRF